MTNARMMTLAVALMLSGFSSAAAAEEDSDKTLYEQGGLAELGLVVGATAGGGFGQVFTDFGTRFVGGLEIGYLLPFLDRSLEYWVSGQYAAPKAEGTAAADPRLPGSGEMTYEVVHNQATIGTGVLYRIPLSTTLIRPYVSVGGLMYLTRTDVTGSAGGESFGENEETATDYGFFGALGAEYYLGPGGLLFEVQTSYASVDHFILRETNSGALNVALGYRLFL